MGRLLFGLVAVALIAFNIRAAQAQVCRLESLGTGIVRPVTDGSTLVLDDGRMVRLAGVAVPQPPPTPEGMAASPSAQATAVLAQRVGREVILKGPAAAPDRYGRLQAFVFLGGEETDESFQHVLLARGLARVTPAAARLGSRACAAELMGRERQARDSGLGIWAAPDYAIVRADDPPAVLRMRGRLALVEGRVLSVRESGGTIYVNFGRRWSEDFTVTIAKRNERIFTAAGLEPKRLERRQVRIRGWVEERGGPWIEATRPEQIELLGPN